MLPESLFNILILLGIFAVSVYITLVEESESYHKRVIGELESAVKKNRSSTLLEDYYRAVSAGDPDDSDYWEETARQFSE